MLTKEESKPNPNKPKQVELTIHDNQQQPTHKKTHLYNSIDQHSDDSLSDNKINELKLMTETIMKMKTPDEMKIASQNIEINDMHEINDSYDNETDNHEWKGLMQETILKMKHSEAETNTAYSFDNIHFKIDTNNQIEDYLSKDDCDNTNKSTLFFICQWFKRYAISILLMILSTTYILLSAFFSGDSPEIWVIRIEFILINITILILFILVYKFISYSLLLCTADIKRCGCCRAVDINKILFYTNHSEKYLSILMFLIMVYILIYRSINRIDERYHELFDEEMEENAYIILIVRDVLFCLILLFLCLFLKILLIRHLLVTYYLLSPYQQQKMSDFQKYEIWLKIILNSEKIFSIEVNDFININSIHETKNTKYKKRYGIPCHSMVLSLTVYEKFRAKMSQLMQDIKPNDFILWHYDPQTNHVGIINDNKLNKLCEKFAQYIILNINTNEILLETKPKQKTSIYNASVEITNMNGGKPKQNISEELNISEATFKACFQNNMNAINAWKAMNIEDSKDEKLTLTELQRWLRQYFHDLIYMKQTFNSYEDILANLDVSTNFIIIFFLLFVILLIFNDSFEKTITMYAALIAVAAIFGGNVMKEFIESVYYIFILNPYSIGDVILIDNVRYTVRHVNIMSTELITSFTSSHFVVIKRNSNLLSKDITNITKSNTPYHNISFYVCQTTPMKKINELRRRIRTFMETEMGTDINDFWFVLNGVDKECRMKITLHIGSNYKFSDAQIMWKQYHKINMTIRHIINQMEIHYKRFSYQDTQQTAFHRVATESSV